MCVAKVLRDNNEAEVRFGHLMKTFAISQAIDWINDVWAALNPINLRFKCLRRCMITIYGPNRRRADTIFLFLLLYDKFTI